MATPRKFLGERRERCLLLLQVSADRAVAPERFTNRKSAREKPLRSPSLGFKSSCMDLTGQLSNRRLQPVLQSLTK
jgi:hypothetical protein